MYGFIQEECLGRERSMVLRASVTRFILTNHALTNVFLAKCMTIIPSFETGYVKSSSDDLSCVFLIAAQFSHLHIGVMIHRFVDKVRLLPSIHEYFLHWQSLLQEE